MSKCPIHDREMETVERYGEEIEMCEMCQAEQVSEFQIERDRR